MKRLLLASAVMVLPFLAGCPGFCGGFSGGNDRVYQRGSESLILCDNGGFVANLTDGSIEGRYTELAANEYTANRGDNGQLAFDFEVDGSGNLDAAQLGATMFTQLQLSTTALDHADVQCQDLETRTWWTAQ